MNNRSAFDFNDGLAHALFLGFGVERIVTIGRNAGYWLTSPGREYGWVEHKPFGAPTGKEWQGHYLDASSGKEVRKRVFGETLSEALGLLAIEVYPKLKANKERDAEIQRRMSLNYSYGTDDFPNLSRR